MINLYSEFNKCGDEDYSCIQSIAYCLGIKIRKNFDKEIEKNIISISCSLVNFLKGKALNEDVNCDSFIHSIKLYLGNSDPIVDDILKQNIDKQVLESKIISRLECIL